MEWGWVYCRLRFGFGTIIIMLCGLLWIARLGDTMKGGLDCLHCFVFFLTGREKNEEVKEGTVEEHARSNYNDQICYPSK